MGPLSGAGAGGEVTAVDDAAVGECTATEDARDELLRHYTTDEGAAGIQATGTIRPSADG